MSEAFRDKPELADVDEHALEGLLTRAHVPPRMDAAARSRVLARLKTEVATRKPRPLMAELRRRAPLLAVVAAAAAALILWWSRGVDSPVTHRNDSRGPVAVSLRDGSTVVLDSGAEVIEKRERRLALVQGRALLDVKQAEAPFVVESADGKLTNSAGRFVVAKDAGGTTLAVARGKVAAEAATGETTLAAGQATLLRAGVAPVPEEARRLSYLASFAQDALQKVAARPEQPVRRGNLLARIPDSSTAWPLTLRELTVEVRVEDGVVRATLDQTFFNHLNSDLEGVYSFPLPPDAAISRLAMYIDGRLTEGGIVERDRGRDIYEGIVCTSRDPALLEWMSGNEFRVRVFPLPARSEKRIILSYTQPLERLYDSARVDVPLPEIDVPVGKVNYRVRFVGGARYDIGSNSHAFEIVSDGEDRVATFAATNEALGQDIVLGMREESPASEEVHGYRDASGSYFMARVQPNLAAEMRQHEPRDWVVLFDTSASRDGAALAAQKRLFTELTRQWDVEDRFTLVAFDATQRVLPGGMRRASDAELEEVLGFLAAETAERIGVTDVAAALARANELLAGRPGHVLYLGDGVATAGETRPAALAALIPGHAFIGVAVGERVDAAVLEGLAEATGGTFVEVDPAEDLGWRAFDLIAELNVSRLDGVEAQLLDASGHEVPAEIHASTRASSGSDIVVLARTKGEPSGPLELALRGRAGGQAWERRLAIPRDAGQARYIPQLWARRHIEALLVNAEDNREAITKLALDNFLVTPFTSLLVLETEEDYAKHRVVRPNADGWAFYQAPARIERRVERIREAARPFGTAVLRWRPRLVPGDFLEDTGVVDELEGSFRTVTLVDRMREAQNFGMTGLIRDPVSGVAAAEDLPTRDPVWARATGTKGHGGLRLGYADNQSLRQGLLQSTESDHMWGGDAAFAENFGQDGLTWSGLDDLSAFVPALFADGVDLEREAIAPHRTADGTVAADAGELLAAAERESARYRVPGGGVLGLGAEGTFALERRTALDLEERLWFDGERLYAVYPELELTVRRDAGAVMAVLREHAPFVTPTAAELEGRYEVRLAGARVLRIAPLGGGEATELTLDDKGRVERFERQGRVLGFTWRPDALEITARDEVVRLERLEGEAPALSEPSGFTRVELPLLERQLLESRLAQAAPRSSEWRQAQRQLLALEAVEGGVRPGLTRLREAGEAPTRGELVLAGLLGGFVEADGKALGASDPVGRYLTALFRSTPSGAEPFTALVREPGLIGTLSAFRAVREHYAHSIGEVRKRYQRLLERRPTLELRHAALAAIGDRIAAESVNEAVALWDDLAAESGGATRRERIIALDARMRAAVALGRAGRGDDAADRLEELLRDADEQAIYLPIAGEVHNAVVGAAGGRERMRHLVLERRTRLIDARTPEALLAAVQMLVTYGTPEDLDAVVAELRMVRVEDGATAYRLAALLKDRDYTSDAERILSGHITGPMAYPALLLLAEITAGDDRTSEAAELIRRAMDAKADVTLDEMRSLYRRRFDLLVRGGRQLGEERLPAALAVAAEWRREDPDNAEIDVLCYRTLTARGDRQEAWRHLSSIIERHPAEGSAHADVAQSLMEQGELAEADRQLLRAFELEPTNPTWLVRRADLLLSLDKRTDARALLEQVVAGTWQDRFAREVSTARSRLTDR